MSEWKTSIQRRVSIRTASNLLHWGEGYVCVGEVDRLKPVFVGQLLPGLLKQGGVYNKHWVVSLDYWIQGVT